jgi:hypothetical protein
MERSFREKEDFSIAQAKRFCVGVARVTRWIKPPDPKITRNKPATRSDMGILARDTSRVIRTRISTSVSKRVRYRLELQVLNV